jgi:hypothetical protein
MPINGWAQLTCYSLKIQKISSATTYAMKSKFTKKFFSGPPTSIDLRLRNH